MAIVLCPDCADEMDACVLGVHRALRHGSGGDADHLGPIRDAMAKGEPIRKYGVRSK
jgi:hypothetical protein